MNIRRNQLSKMVFFVVFDFIATAIQNKSYGFFIFLAIFLHFCGIIRHVQNISDDTLRFSNQTDDFVVYRIAQVVHTNRDLSMYCG